MTFQFSDPELFQQCAWIAGRPAEARSRDTLPVTNPVDGSLVGHVPRLARNEVEAAIGFAAEALPEWRGRTAAERGALLTEWARLLRAHVDDLAPLMTLESGKPIGEARGEVGYAAAFLDWFAAEGQRAYGETIPSHRRDARILVLREPVGVVAAITPWNFPAAMITRKAGPALAAGCPFLVKPAEQTPFSALALAVLAARAGVPEGVFQVLTGDPEEVGGVLSTHPLVRKLSFTGSTEVGRLLLAQSASTVKRVSLELGGNAPFLVFDDADLDAAVEGALASKFRNAGQTCVCVNRFLVQAGVYDEFAARLTRRVEKLRVGDGLDPASEIGPLIDDAGLAKVEAHVRDAVERGGRVLCGGERAAAGKAFFAPTVIADAEPGMRCAREETFGPVAPLFRFESEEQALRMANDTEAGLAAYVYTRDAARVWRVSEALEYGMVGVNEGIVSTPVAPFGGIKQSGIGREGSRHGLDEYLEIKYVLMGGLDD